MDRWQWQLKQLKFETCTVRELSCWDLEQFLSVVFITIVHAKHTSCAVSLATVVSQKSAHPLLWSNFLYRVQVYWNECPPWNELRVTNRTCSWSLRSKASSAMHIWGKKVYETMVNFFDPPPSLPFLWCLVAFKATCTWSKITAPPRCS